jgi:hypothetical protein
MRRPASACGRAGAPGAPIKKKPGSIYLFRSHTLTAARQGPPAAAAGCAKGPDAKPQTEGAGGQTKRPFNSGPSRQARCHPSHAETKACHIVCWAWHVLTKASTSQQGSECCAVLCHALRYALCCCRCPTFHQASECCPVRCHALCCAMPCHARHYALRCCCCPTFHQASECCRPEPCSGVPSRPFTSIIQGAMSLDLQPYLAYY